MCMYAADLLKRQIRARLETNKKQNNNKTSCNF